MKFDRYDKSPLKIEMMRRLLAEAEKEAEKEEKPKDPPADEGGDEDPFAAAEGGGGDAEGGGENPWAAEGGEEGEEESDDKGDAEPAEPKGVPVKFDVASARKYNKSQFASGEGIVKSIDSRGVEITTQPDQVDVFVNFNDIRESARKFFKNNK